MPLAVQLIAHPAADGAGEALLLAVAAQLEAGAPWVRTAPVPHATVG